MACLLCTHQLPHSRTPHNPTHFELYHFLFCTNPQDGGQRSVDPDPADYMVRLLRLPALRRVHLHTTCRHWLDVLLPSLPCASVPGAAGAAAGGAGADASARAGGANSGACAASARPRGFCNPAHAAPGGTASDMGPAGRGPLGGAGAGAVCGDGGVQLEEGCEAARGQGEQEVLGAGEGDEESEARERDTGRAELLTHLSLEVVGNPWGGGEDGYGWGPAARWRAGGQEGGEEEREEGEGAGRAWGQRRRWQRQGAAQGGVQGRARPPHMLQRLAALRSLVALHLRVDGKCK